MAKEATKKKAPAKPAGDLSVQEIQEITDKVASLRGKIRDTGATVLSPTAEWDRLRKEIALLNKSLNVDAAAKLSASRAAALAAVASVAEETTDAAV